MIPIIQMFLAASKSRPGRNNKLYNVIHNGPMTGEIPCTDKKFCLVRNDTMDKKDTFYSLQNKGSSKRTNVR